MKNITKIAFFVIWLSGILSCSTVLGPPGSGNELPPPPPTSSLFLETIIEGQPDLSSSFDRGGYYVWKDGNFWHIRITRIDKPLDLYPDLPLFTGNIFVQGGIIFDLKKYNVGRYNDVRDRTNDITYRFKIKRDIEGFDFEIQPTDIEYCITLDLRVNRRSIPEYVHLGDTRHIPEILPIRVCTYD
jgi:hypothetical protein